MRVLDSGKKMRNKISRGFTPFRNKKAFNVKGNSETKFLTGFTLIELLVVIAVIAILAVMIIIRVSGVQRDARNTKRIMDMRDIKQAFDMYLANGGKLQPNVTSKEIHLARLDDTKGCPYVNVPPLPWYPEWLQCVLHDSDDKGKRPSDYFTSTNYYPRDPQYKYIQAEYDAGEGIFYEISTDGDGNYTITRPIKPPIAPDNPISEEVPDLHG